MLKLNKEEREALYSDFPDEGDPLQFDRETIKKHSRNCRSVRLAGGRWYTPAEMEERAKKAFCGKCID